MAFSKVAVDGLNAQITDFDQQITKVQYTSVEELINYVRDNFEDAFMTSPETATMIEADPEIESLVRQKLWEYEE